MWPNHRSTALLDDRGRGVELRALRAAREMGGLGGSQDPQLADLRLRAYLTANRERRLWRSAVMALVGGFTGAAVVLALPRILPGVPMWVSIVVLACIVAGLATWRTSRALTRRCAGISNMFLAEGRCPGCAYVLDGVGASPSDGCIVCPECGAAWKSSRVGSAIQAPPAMREYRRRIHQPTLRERFFPGMRGRLMTQDAAGQTVHLSNPRLRGLDAQTAATIGAPRIELIQRSIGWRDRVKGLVIGLAILPGIATFALMIVRARPTGSPIAILFTFATFLFAGLMILLLTGIIFSMFFGDVGLSGKRVARVFIAQRICPQCLAAMEGLIADEEQTVCCGSCRARWRLDTPQALAAQADARDPRAQPTPALASKREISSDA